MDEYLHGRLDAIEKKVDSLVETVSMLVADFHSKRGIRTFLWKAWTVVGTGLVLFFTWLQVRPK